MDRYTLTWGSLGALSLLAVAAWWQASEPSMAPPAAAAPLSGGSATSLTDRAGSPPPLGLAAARLGQGSNPEMPLTPESTAGLSAATRSQPTGLLSPSFVTASLRALGSHGVRLNQPQVSLHTVQTVDLPTAQALAHWARRQGFTVRPPVKVLEHGGEVNWVLPIERHAVLEMAQILADGQRISLRASQAPGARYHSWQVPVEGRSTLGGAAQS